MSIPIPTRQDAPVVLQDERFETEKSVVVFVCRMTEVVVCGKGGEMRCLANQRRWG